MLVVAFKPFGIGLILRRNDSLICLRKLQQEYPDFNYLVLPVNDRSMDILDKTITDLNPTKIFLMGVGSMGVRIETKTHRNNQFKISEFAKSLKSKFDYMNENIGDYYCNKVYYVALSRCAKSVFVHVPYFVKYDKIKSIFNEFIKQ